MAVIKVDDSTLKALNLKKIHNDHKSLNETIVQLLQKKDNNNGI